MRTEKEIRMAIQTGEAIIKSKYYPDNFYGEEGTKIVTKTLKMVLEELKQ